MAPTFRVRVREDKWGQSSRAGDDFLALKAEEEWDVGASVEGEDLGPFSDAKGVVERGARRRDVAPYFGLWYRRR